MISKRERWASDMRIMFMCLGATVVLEVLWILALFELIGWLG
jgi:hypothetical protein